MFSIFACPKPFTDPHTAIIQRNAITSWTLLHPKPEVILFGDDEGIASICDELGLRHVAEVGRNEFGTPLLNDLFAKANQVAQHNLLCYVNADIILTSDFMRAVQEVYHWRKRALMVGQRKDLPIREPWDFTKPDWEAQLRACSLGDSRPQRSYGADYFLYPKGLYDGDLPSFGLGRGRWDGWLIFRARELGCPVVDITPVVVVIHQDHDYSHLAYAAPYVGNLTAHEFWRQAKGQLVEFQRNTTLCDSATRVKFGLIDATHVLTSRGAKLALDRKHLSRFLVSLPVLHPSWRPLIRVAASVIKGSLPLRQALRRTTSKFASAWLT